MSNVILHMLVCSAVVPLQNASKPSVMLLLSGYNVASSPGSTSAPPSTGQIIKRCGGSLVSNVAHCTPQLSNMGGYYAPPMQLHIVLHGGTVIAHLACGARH